MEKCCEFCRALRPVVYCKADAAHLCLPCDAKIHSANTVFNRHQRTVLCEACQCRPAYVPCLDHGMFMCNECDQSQYMSASQHQHKKRTLRSYTGCPAAKDFAALWGFQSNGIGDKTLSSSGGLCDSSVMNYDNNGNSCSQIECLPEGAQSRMGSISKQKIRCEGKEFKKTSFILHQILDLERLQLTQNDQSSSAHDTWKNDENVDQHLQLCENTGTNFQLEESPLQNVEVDPLPFPFSQLDQLPSSSTIRLPSQTETIWQCRSPVQNSQLWSQNMQDLGVCEEIVCHDDFSMPDVDLTFRSFEEIFECDQDATRGQLDGNGFSHSPDERDMSLDKSDDYDSRTNVIRDASEASSIYTTQPADGEKVEDVVGSTDIPLFSSNLSFSRLGNSTVNNNADSRDTATSSTSPDEDSRKRQVRANSRMRYKEKKQARLNEMKFPYSSRKATVDVQRRGKGRIITTEE